jgi:hypothetical protein
VQRLAVYPRRAEDVGLAIFGASDYAWGGDGEEADELEEFGQPEA